MWVITRAIPIESVSILVYYTGMANENSPPSVNAREVMDETKGCKVLVISDFPSWKGSIEGMLKRGGRRGDRVTFAPSGHKGLALVRRGPPDLIIYYLWTLDLDGYEFCRRLAG